MEAGIIVMPE